MAAPTTDPSITAVDKVHVAWVALSSTAATGGSPVTSYHVEWDQGTGTW